MTRVLVAGVGNLFLSDDGFGTEVVRRLGDEELPPEVRVADFGVGAVHLAYDLMEGCDLLVLVDAAPRGGRPGTLYVIEPELPEPDTTPPHSREVAAADQVLLDAHAITPDGVLGLVGRLRPSIRAVRVVGCEPATVEEGLGLSPPVEAAVEGAVGLVKRLIDETLAPAGEQLPSGARADAEEVM